MQGLHFSELLPKITSSGRFSLFGFFKKTAVICSILTFSLASPLILETVFAQTTTTRVYLSGSTSSGIIGIVGNKTMPVVVKVDNVTTTSGLAAFSFKISYNPNLVSIPDSDNNYIADPETVSVGTFLGSTGKQVRCGDGYIDTDLNDSTLRYLTFICGTLGSTPAAPTGSGILATINFKTGSIVGSVPLNLVKVELADNTASANLIQNTTTNGSALVAKCADFNGDHLVKGEDILYVVRKYQTNDSTADLDNSGLVTGLDILIAVREYNNTC